MHLQRNLRFLAFGILPILGFVLGWGLNEKTRVEPVVQSPAYEEALRQSPQKLAGFFRATSAREEVDLAGFWEVWNQLEETFYHPEEVQDTEKMLHGAMRGLARALDDPYTVFLDPAEAQQFDSSIDGEFFGIGAEIILRHSQIMVVSPLKSSPAELAGVMPGDVIFAVDDEPTAGMNAFQAALKIRGKKGEPVKLTILREDEERPLEIIIVRDKIVTPNVEWEMQDEVAVISIYQFGSTLAKELAVISQEILLESPKGIVVDLRGNGGGVLDIAIEVASEFLQDKLIVKTKGQMEHQHSEMYSGKDGAFTEIPLIVLINKGSASASEILAGAVMDHQRGLVLGEQSFGKGSVQTVVPLQNGANLKVTSGEWLTPLGHSINEKGIPPHEVVVTTLADIEAEFDPVLNRALELMGTPEMSRLIQDGWEERQKELEQNPEAAETPANEVKLDFGTPLPPTTDETVSSEESEDAENNEPEIEAEPAPEENPDSE